MNERSLNVIAMAKNGHRYVVLYDDASVAEAILKLGNYAADPELEFGWADAVRLVEEMKRFHGKEQCSI